MKDRVDTLERQLPAQGAAAPAQMVPASVVESPLSEPHAQDAGVPVDKVADLERQLGEDRALLAQLQAVTGATRQDLSQVLGAGVFPAALTVQLATSLIRTRRRFVPNMRYAVVRRLAFADTAAVRAGVSEPSARRKLRAVRTRLRFACLQLNEIERKQKEQFANLQQQVRRREFSQRRSPSRAPQPVQLTALRSTVADSADKSEQVQRASCLTFVSRSLARDARLTRRRPCPAWSPT